MQRQGTKGLASKRAHSRGMRIAAPAVAAALAAVATAAWAQADKRFEEHALASVPRGIEVGGGIEFSLDGLHVAYAGSSNSVPVVDDKVFDTFWWVGRPSFGTDGHVVFKVVNPPGKRVQKSWALLDGKKDPETVGFDLFAWSPDGRKLAYVAMPECRIAEDLSREGDCFLVIDGKKGSAWHLISEPVWSRDSNHVLATAEAKGKQCVLLDNKPLAEGSRYEGPVFSPDGRRVAYACEQPEKGGPAADGTRIKWFVVCDKLRLGTDFDRAASPVFSPDGRHIAFKAETAGRVGVSIDGAAPQGTWAFVTEPVFSPDGEHVAFAASDDCTVVPGSRVTRAGDGFVSGGNWQLVVDGKPQAEKFVALRDVTWSPDGKRIAYRARSGQRWRVVCGTAKSAEFDFVGPPQFQPGTAYAARIAFGVLTGRDFAWKVMVVE